MKNIYSVTLLVSALFLTGNALATVSKTASNIASPQMSEKVFSIEKMTCKMCNITIRKAMEKVDGVVKATVDYNTKTATVLFDPKKANVDAIALASTNIGYPATLKK
ncbi:MAG: cation transporter [Colwellia sp.]|nr:cation transporter [Colwellia sp.]MCW8863579.1 cation transporter [Colwellia sp.]MCW9082768.1 cation transporter [Colwellia sp.]